MAEDGTLQIVVNAPVSACPARARATLFGAFRLVMADNVEIVAPLTVFLDGLDKGDRIDEAAPQLRGGPFSDTTPRVTPAR